MTIDYISRSDTKSTTEDRMKKYWVIATQLGIVKRVWVSDSDVRALLEQGCTVIRASTDQVPIIVNGDVLWKDMEEGEFE